MERKILTLSDFILEQDAIPPVQTTIASPESEREAKSRIASGLVNSLFGETGVNIGAEGGDSRIELAKEVIESVPYKGCGATDPYKLEKTPIGVGTFKILLTYLQSIKAGDYSRSLSALLDKRSVIIGFRNKIEVKKNPANQDRFIDSLYFIQGNAKDGTEKSNSVDTLASTKKDETTKSKVKSKKNEDLDFQRIYKEASKIQEEKGYGILAYEDFYQIYESQINEGFFGDAWDSGVSFVKNLFGGGEKEDKDLTDKSSTKKIDKIKVPVVALTPKPTGDKIMPYQITTVPSLAYYGKTPINPKGTGIKMPGDTLYYLKESTLGKETYKMMVEGEQINVGRYPIGITKFESYKPSDIYKESCGMEIHRSSTKGVGVCVGPWSAGCQVFADYQEFKDFISKAERETMNANKFIYALINIDDIPEDIMKAAMEGNLTQEGVDTIVNASGKDGDLKTGPLSKVVRG